jgi:predicted HD superfamily hydrolase involved in NAD metabolism
MIFEESSLAKLREAMKMRLSEKRYKHTLGVEDMARYLGSIIIPKRVDELCAAALLHDIAKELSYEELLDLLKSGEALYSEEDLKTKPALHSIAAIPVIKRDFTEYATKDILSAVENHTLGNEGMSVFDEIIYISDYAEAGRTYPTCQSVRKYLLDNISHEKALSDNLKALHIALLSSIESTIDSLARRNEEINKRTFSTKCYLEHLIH